MRLASQTPETFPPFIVDADSWLCWKQCLFICLSVFLSVFLSVESYVSGSSEVTERDRL